MLTSRHAFAVALAATLALPACSDIAGLGDASDIVGTFALETVDGEPLPVRGSYPAGFFATTEILADTVRIDDRTWERSRYLRSSDPTLPGEGVSWEQRTSGHITAMNGGRFMLDAPCNDTGDCVANEIFTVRGDTLVIDVSSDYLFRDLRFVRISPPK